MPIHMALTACRSGGVCLQAGAFAAAHSDQTETGAGSPPPIGVNRTQGAPNDKSKPRRLRGCIDDYLTLGGGTRPGAAATSRWPPQRMLPVAHPGSLRISMTPGAAQSAIKQASRTFAKR